MEDKIQTIVNAIDLAIQKGCYSLNDAAAVIDALREVFPKEEKAAAVIDALREVFPKEEKK